MKTLTRHRAISCLNRWNALTNPAICRTDDEHGRCRRAARRLQRIIGRHLREGIDYKEDGSGRLYPERDTYCLNGHTFIA